MFHLKSSSTHVGGNFSNTNNNNEPSTTVPSNNNNNNATAIINSSVLSNAIHRSRSSSSFSPGVRHQASQQQSIRSNKNYQSPTSSSSSSLRVINVSTNTDSSTTTTTTSNRSSFNNGSGGSNNNSNPINYILLNKLRVQSSNRTTGTGTGTALSSSGLGAGSGPSLRKTFSLMMGNNSSSTVASTTGVITTTSSASNKLYHPNTLSLATFQQSTKTNANLSSESQTSLMNDSPAKSPTSSSTTNLVRPLASVSRPIITRVNASHWLHNHRKHAGDVGSPSSPSSAATTNSTTMNHRYHQLSNDHATTAPMIPPNTISKSTAAAAAAAATTTVATANHQVKPDLKRITVKQRQQQRQQHPSTPTNNSHHKSTASEKPSKSLLSISNQSCSLAIDHDQQKSSSSINEDDQNGVQSKYHKTEIDPNSLNHQEQQQNTSKDKLLTDSIVEQQSSPKFTNNLRLSERLENDFIMPTTVSMNIDDKKNLNQKCSTTMIQMNTCDKISGGGGGSSVIDNKNISTQKFVQVVDEHSKIIGDQDKFLLANNLVKLIEKASPEFLFLLNKSANLSYQMAVFEKKLNYLEKVFVIKNDDHQELLILDGSNEDNNDDGAQMMDFCVQSKERIDIGDRSDRHLWLKVIKRTRDWIGDARSKNPFMTQNFDFSNSSLFLNQNQKTTAQQNDFKQEMLLNEWKTNGRYFNQNDGLRRKQNLENNLRHLDCEQSEDSPVSISSNDELIFLLERIAQFSSNIILERTKSMESRRSLINPDFDWSFKASSKNAQKDSNHDLSCGENAIIDNHCDVNSSIHDEDDPKLFLNQVLHWIDRTKNENEEESTCFSTIVERITPAILDPMVQLLKTNARLMQIQREFDFLIRVHLKSYGQSLRDAKQSSKTTTNAISSLPKQCFTGVSLPPSFHFQQSCKKSGLRMASPMSPSSSASALAKRKNFAVNSGQKQQLQQQHNVSKAGHNKHHHQTPTNGQHYNEEVPFAVDLTKLQNNFVSDGDSGGEFTATMVTNDFNQCPAEDELSSLLNQIALCSQKLIEQNQSSAQHVSASTNSNSTVSSGCCCCFSTTSTIETKCQGVCSLQQQQQHHHHHHHHHQQQQPQQHLQQNFPPASYVDPNHRHQSNRANDRSWPPAFKTFSLNGINQHIKTGQFDSNRLYAQMMDVQKNKFGLMQKPTGAMTTTAACCQDKMMMTAAATSSSSSSSISFENSNGAIYPNGLSFKPKRQAQPMMKMMSRSSMKNNIGDGSRADIPVWSMNEPSSPFMADSSNHQHYSNHHHHHHQHHRSHHQMMNNDVPNNHFMLSSNEMMAPTPPSYSSRYSLHQILPQFQSDSGRMVAMSECNNGSHSAMNRMLPHSSSALIFDPNVDVESFLIEVEKELDENYCYTSAPPFMTPSDYVEDYANVGGTSSPSSSALLLSNRRIVGDESGQNHPMHQHHHHHPHQQHHHNNNNLCHHSARQQIPSYGTSPLMHPHHNNTNHRLVKQQSTPSNNNNYEQLVSSFSSLVNSQMMNLMPPSASSFSHLNSSFQQPPPLPPHQQMEISCTNPECFSDIIGGGSDVLEDGNWRLIQRDHSVTNPSNFNSLLNNNNHHHHHHHHQQQQQGGKAYHHMMNSRSFPMAMMTSLPSGLNPSVISTKTMSVNDSPPIHQYHQQQNDNLPSTLSRDLLEKFRNQVSYRIHEETDQQLKEIDRWLEQQLQNTNQTSDPNAAAMMMMMMTNSSSSSSNKPLTSSTTNESTSTNLATDAPRSPVKRCLLKKSQTISVASGGHQLQQPKRSSNGLKTSIS